MQGINRRTYITVQNVVLLLFQNQQKYFDNQNYSFQQLNHPKLKVRVKLIVVVILQYLVQPARKVMGLTGVMVNVYGKMISVY